MERLCMLNTATMSSCQRWRIWRQSQHKTHWIAFKGHSRSRILGSLKSWRGTAYYYIIMWAL